MSAYVGLDVSLEGTSVCILDDSGRVMLEVPPVMLLEFGVARSPVT